MPFARSLTDPRLADSFVGRDGEMRMIAHMMRTRLPAGVVIWGPTGAGKTRLAKEVVNRATSSGVRTAVVSASAISPRVPFGALSIFAELVNPAPTPAPTPGELADSIVAKLSAGPSPQPPVLVVDDAHLLDDLSLLVIERLAASGEVFLVITAPAGQGESTTLEDMCVRGLLRALELAPLSPEDAQLLVEQSLSGPVDHSVTRQLFDLSLGNPLLVVELLHGSLEAEQLICAEGAWTLLGPLTASARIREVVELRLRGLSSEERCLLELLTLVDRMTQKTVEHFSSIATLVALEERSLITTTLSKRQLSVTLALPIYRDVLRSNMSGLRTQIAAKTLALHLEMIPDLDDTACLQLAGLRLLGGGGDPALMCRAAGIALDRHDLDLALECADVAVELDGGIDARFLRARILAQRGEFEVADLEIGRCLELARTEEQFARSALLRLDFLTFWQGHVTDALRFAAVVEARITDPALRNSIAARRVGALMYTDGPQSVADAIESLLNTDLGEVESWICMLAAWAYLRLGRFREAHTISCRGAAIQDAHNHPTDWYPELHQVTCRYAEAGAGRFTEARTAAETALAEAQATQSLEAIGDYSLFLASLVRDTGGTGDALSHADEAEAAFRALGRDLYVADAIVHRAIVLAMAGRGEAALDSLETLDRTILPQNWYFLPELHQARAWAFAANGLRLEARSEFLESAGISARTGDLVGALTAWHGLARIGYAQQSVEQMKRITQRAESDLTRLRLRHTVGLATQDASNLQAVSEEFEAIGADLLAGEAALGAARALAQQGARRTAEQWQRRATAILRYQSGPLLVMLRPRAVGDLTAAELDTARLATQGKHNAEIAEALGLSVRTVENRLQRVYVKLGVTNREALTDLDV